ncbi:uncharacterized protein [Primulina eburnea]|uniref:uncharacterized protein n=1 Tax=Primulina eburnea TaxID=1245227 RepID=UPI003C6C2BD7
MAEAEEVHFSLKVMMMKESNKVIYAEVDSDFADVLFSFLTLPLGKIMRLLLFNGRKYASTVGSLRSLFLGFLRLDSGHFWTEEGREMLFHQRNSSAIECRRLKLQIDDTPPIKYFMCGNWTCVSMYANVQCPCSTSRNTMTRTDVEVVAGSGEQSAFTMHRASFLLTDDLCIMTNTSASLLRILKLNGIEHTRVLEEKTMRFGLEEIMKLLEGSLVSETPITDIILCKTSAAATLDKGKHPVSAKYESNAFPHAQNSENISSDSKKITVKVLVQKSTNMILLAQSSEDFVDFLFSFLTIPLGRVLFLLGNNASYLWSINNLYRSISNLEVGMYMKSKETNTKLLEPQIPPYHLSNHQIFPLSQQNPPVICKRFKNGYLELFVPSISALGHTEMKMIHPKGQDSFVKGPATFMVTDDLKVTTPSSNFIVSTLKEMNIPISDVDEQELDIGIDEALSILKASLTSTLAASLCRCKSVAVKY